MVGLHKSQVFRLSTKRVLEKGLFLLYYRYVDMVCI